MKKYAPVAVLLVVMALMIAALLWGHFRPASEADEKRMTIYPTEFSEETKEILDLIDDKIFFYDFSVDDTIRSLSVDTWYCEDGEWQHGGSTYGGLDLGDFRIALEMDKDSYSIYHVNANGHTKVQSAYPVDFSGSMGVSQTHLSNAEPIEAGREILLWLKFGHGSTVSVRTDDDFREIDCESGMAVMVTFSEEPIE